MRAVAIYECAPTPTKMLGLMEARLDAFRADLAKRANSAQIDKKRARAVAPTARTVVWATAAVLKESNHPPTLFGVRATSYYQCKIPSWSGAWDARPGSAQRSLMGVGAVRRIRTAPIQQTNNWHKKNPADVDGATGY